MGLHRDHAFSVTVLFYKLAVKVPSVYILSHTLCYYKLSNACHTCTCVHTYHLSDIFVCFIMLGCSPNLSHLSVALMLSPIYLCCFLNILFATPLTISFANCTRSRAGCSYETVLQKQRCTGYRAQFTR